MVKFGINNDNDVEHITIETKKGKEKNKGN